MLRETLFWEVEVVRVEGGAPAAPAWRLDFSVRPLNYVLGVFLAAAAALTAAAGYAFSRPNEDRRNWATACGFGPEVYDEPVTYRGCGCGIRPPNFPVPDSTLLVRRLP